MGVVTGGLCLGRRDKGRACVNSRAGCDGAASSPAGFKQNKIFVGIVVSSICARNLHDSRGPCFYVCGFAGVWGSGVAGFYVKE